MVSEPHEVDLEVVQKLSVQIEEERKRLSTSEDQSMLFRKYTMKDDYSCKDKKVDLLKGDVVEILDTEKETMWLVRKQADKEKVGYARTKE